MWKINFGKDGLPNCLLVLILKLVVIIHIASSRTYLPRLLYTPVFIPVNAITTLLNYADPKIVLVHRLSSLE